MEKEIRSLQKKIRDWQNAYYKDDKPIVTDLVYNKEYQRLIVLENKSGKVWTDSPTQTVGVAVEDGKGRVTHPTRMLSLFNAFSLDDLRKWYNKMLAPEITVEPKWDGVSLNVVYNQGRLEVASSRGDGTVGEVLTDNSMLLDGLPSSLSRPFPEFVEVVGEVVMPMELWRSVKKEYKDPRNAAAGILRGGDKSAGSLLEELKFIPYGIGRKVGKQPKSGIEIYELLKKLGFGNAYKPTVLGRDWDGVIDDYKNPEEIPTDGLVFKANDVGVRLGIGNNNNHPKWAIAYKYPEKESLTTLTEIIAQVGKTGVVTPVAIFEPVLVGNATVGRASLHNYPYAKALGITTGVNTSLAVIRAGAVVPKITRVITPDGEILRTPKKCPSCGSSLVTEGKFTVCKAGYGCPSQVLELLKHFVSRKAMDIRGLGMKSIQALLLKGAIEDPRDLYKESFLEDLVEEIGNKRAGTVLEGIGYSKKLPFAKLLYALSIPNLGLEGANKVAETYPDLASLEKATSEELASTGIGEVSGESLYIYLTSNSIKLIRDLTKSFNTGEFEKEE